jgi:hypothetical protein
LTWATLDPARSPGELALSLVAAVGLLGMTGWLAWMTTNGDRKDG